MSSCTSYSSKPGRLEGLVGTYELVTYKMKHEEITEGDNTYDKKAEIGAVAYFSIAKDGYAFYGYKDNSTAPRVDQMFATFFYSEKKPKLIEAVDLTDGVTSRSDNHKAPGCLDEPKMGFKSELFSKTLNYTVHSGHLPLQKDVKVPYRYVEYKKVSREASLAKVNQYLGTSVIFSKPYEMKAMTGYAVYRCNPKDGEIGSRGIYEYAILDFNSYSNGELNLIYSLKENPGQNTKKLSVVVEEAGKTVKLEGLSKPLYSSPGQLNTLSYGDFYSKSEDYPDGDPYYGENFSTYYGNEATLEYIIQQEKGLL
ncbi:MAG: hypothetical protein IKP50_05655 [Bacilli bacterium]|nr:hypothetical protein [Bacilli bacterium]